MSTRIHPHSPLPAPAMRANTPSTQSKSSVLAGVQDAYWSDDEAEDAECPLCLEEMDISDLNFKPCPCGYQICRFCWHHIKENLNGRCPACRREYSDETVQFKPINQEDHKRLTQQKKQRERERKELDALGRRQLANVRVVQRNVVYVVGIGPRFAKEELIPTLRSHELFGQYGKISKIIIVKRSPLGGRAPVVGLYVTFHRREDAARCIAAVDGAASPGGGNEVMRASYGTTKYCMAFLRGVNCADHSCMSLHEWGDENDCFTKEDLTTLKHTMKDTENRTRTVTVVKKAEESEGLPRAASWAAKGHNNVATIALLNSTNANQTQLPVARQAARRPASTTRPQRSSSSALTSTAPATTSGRERKTTKAPSLASSSRPPTPAGSAAAPSASGANAEKHKEHVPSAVDTSRPATPSAESDAAPAVHNLASSTSDGAVLLSPEPAVAPLATPPGLPAKPPGLPAPPGLPPSSQTPLSTESSPQIPMQISQGPYQISTQAQALVEDVKARREASSSSSGTSPFPDFDRMLQLLSVSDSGFSFSLDPKLAGESEEEDPTLGLPDFNTDPSIPFNGTFIDAFPRLRQPPPPGLGFTSPFAPGPSALDRPSTASNYTGSFNPFASDAVEESSRQLSPLDEERKMSRFTFARGRQGSAGTSVPSPLHVPSSLSHNETSTYYAPSEVLLQSGHSSPQFGFGARSPHQNSLHQSHSSLSSPLAQYVQPQPQYVQQQQQPRFQSFDQQLSEAQLRDFINSSRDRAGSARGSADQFRYNSNQPFNDPAIMSVRMASPSPLQDGGFGSAASGLDNYAPSQQVAFGPPPGLVYPQGMVPNSVISNRHGQGMGGIPTPVDMSQVGGSAHVSASTSPVASPALSSSDFPALSTTVAAAETSPRHESSPSQSQQPESPAQATDVQALDSKGRAKADRQAARKVAADERAERAAVRAKAFQEKAAAKAAEKERLAQEKAAEKERVVALKAEKERAEKDIIAKEMAEKERLEKEKAQKELAEKEKTEKEKEKEQEKKAAGKAKQTATKSPKDSETSSPSIPSTPIQPSTPKATKRKDSSKSTSTPISTPPAELVTQAPILAKMPKKNKPVTKPIKIPKEDSSHDIHSTLVSATNSDAPQLPDVQERDSNVNSRSHSVDTGSEPKTLKELLAEIDTQFPWMRLSEHPFFDMMKINPAAKMPLEYGPLVHALSALSVGGGSFANNMPSGSIDNAVSSFQQLLETLTQTISDLLRLLPRTTWDDSSSFDGVLRDMLKGDDFLDDGTEEHGAHGNDEVTQLTKALERRARWMEVQLSKLEELHRDINTAAVRAVLAFNDNGWDMHGFMPRVGNTLQDFEKMGYIDQNGLARAMSVSELEQCLADAELEEEEAETALKASIQDMQALLKAPLEEEHF